MAIDLTEANLQGIGRGGAIVLGQNKALAGLQQQYQQDLLRRQKEDAEVADQVAKINYDAARNEDLPEIMKRYTDIKNTFTKLRGTNNAMERIKLQADINAKKAELTRGVNLSKQAAQQLGDLGKLRLTHPDDISDDFTPNYKALSGLSVFDPKFGELAEKTSSTAMLPKFDNNAYAKTILDKSIDNVQGAEVKKKDGRLNYVVRDEGKRLNPENVLNKAIDAYKADPRFRRQLDSQYKGVPHDEAIKRYAEDLYNSNKDAYDTVKSVNVRQYTDEPKDRFYEHYDYQLKNPKPTKNGTAEESQLYRQKWVEDMLGGVKGSGEELKAVVAARGEYEKPLVINTEKDGIIKIKVPDKNVMSFDANGQVKMKLIPSRTLTFDKSNPTDKVKLNALVSELTKENVSVSKFKTGNASGKIKTPAKEAKTVPMSKVKSLVGKKGYEGYSEKELVDYYKSQGYTIK